MSPSTGVPADARRYDLGDLREEVEFFGLDQERVFGCRHLPQGDPVVGVVICSSLYEDFVRNYRKEVLLARALCARGYAIQRFHFRGTGHSDGDPETITFTTMLEDATSAAARLRDVCGVGSIAFIGSRFGGLIASAASRSQASPLVLCEPATSGSAFFREAFQARALREARMDNGDRSSARSPLEELDLTGVVDVLGYGLYRSLYDSAVNRSLEQEVGESPRPLLLVQMSSTDHLRKEYGKQVAAWKTMAFDVESVVVRLEEAWWFTGAEWHPEEHRESTTRLIGNISEWIDRLSTNAVLL